MTDGQSMENHQVSTVFVVLIAAVAALGGFLFGFDSGVINGTVTALAEAFGSNAAGTGISVASMLLGCAVGAFVVGPVSDRTGRKVMMIVTAALFGLSAWGSGVSDSTGEFIVYRLLGGLGVGAASVLSPAYISEVAPAHLRGRLASLQQLGIVVGLFAAFVSNFLISKWAGGASEVFWGGWQAFRWMFWAEIVPALLLLFGALWIPESPRFLVAAKRETEAEKVFAKIHGGSPAAKVAQVRASLDADHRPQVSDLLENGKVRSIVWVGILLSVFQQFVGINVVFYYGEVLWRSVGFSESEALLVNLFSGGVNIVSTFVAISLIDRVGRKPLLLVGSAGMAVSLAFVAGSLATASVSANGSIILGNTAGIVALVSANVYVFCFGASWGPCVWVLLGEMFSNRIRGAALSAGAGAQWIANFAITVSFPVMLHSLGVSFAYGVYAAFALLSFFFVKHFVRETSGRSLEEM